MWDSTATLESSLWVSYIVKHNLPYDPAILSWVFTQEKWRCTSPQGPTHKCVQQLRSFIVTKNWKQLHIHYLWVEGRLYSFHAMTCYSVVGGIDYSCREQHDWTSGTIFWVREADTEVRIQCECVCMIFWVRQNCRYNSQISVARCWGPGEGIDSKEAGGDFWGDKDFLYPDCGGGYMTIHLSKSVNL